MLTVSPLSTSSLLLRHLHSDTQTLTSPPVMYHNADNPHIDRHSLHTTTDNPTSIPITGHQFQPLVKWSSGTEEVSTFTWTLTLTQPSLPFTHWPKRSASQRWIPFRLLQSLAKEAIHKYRQAPSSPVLWKNTPPPPAQTLDAGTLAPGCLSL